MLFTIQGFIQDRFHNNGFEDNDGYAIKLANLYFYRRKSYSGYEFQRKLHRLRTIFYSANNIPNRVDFEENLLSILDNKFYSLINQQTRDVQSPISSKPQKGRSTRLTIKILLERFVKSIERKGVDAFWNSRTKGILRQRPEKIASNDLCIFVESEFISRSGIVLSEIKSGIGYIDVEIIISSVIHIVELKVITDDLTGVDQLIDYLLTEEKKEGFLVIFDARSPSEKSTFPSVIIDKGCKVHIITIDINPLPPSKLN